MEDGQLSNNKIGIADMVINFVPGSGNPMGIDTKEWASLSEFERLDIVLNEISKSSFEYLELAIPWINNLSDNYSFTNIMNLINKYNLRVGSFCSLMPANIKTVGPNFSEELIEKYLQTVFNNCSQIGGNIIVFGSGGSRNIPDNYSLENAKLDIVKFLTIADSIIEEKKYSFKIAIEPLNKKECNFINSVLEAYDIVKEINSSNIGILIDTYHAYYQDTNILDDICFVKDKLLHIHLAQPQDRKWPGHLQDNVEFSFSKFFAKLKENSYSGNLTVECNFDNFPLEIDKCSSFLLEKRIEIQKES
jgi:D-psicose/D-tagatose/L-ribulose 3-epimerase